MSGITIKMCRKCLWYYTWLIGQIFKKHDIPRDIARYIQTGLNKDYDFLVMAFDESNGGWHYTIQKQARGGYWADFYCEFNVPCHLND